MLIFATFTLIEYSLLSISILLMICFFQSSLDKIWDRKGNLEWMVPHFSSSVFHKIIPFLLSIITVLEVVTGILFLVGIVIFFFKGINVFILYALLCSISTLICLFTGQRLAKDYVGAYILVVYFILSIIGIILFDFVVH